MILETALTIMLCISSVAAEVGSLELGPPDEGTTNLDFYNFTGSVRLTYLGRVGKVVFPIGSPAPPIANLLTLPCHNTRTTGDIHDLMVLPEVAPLGRVTLDLTVSPEVAPLGGYRAGFVFDNMIDDNEVNVVGFAVNVDAKKVVMEDNNSGGKTKMEW
jgi:hypothetical protein